MISIKNLRNERMVNAYDVRVDRKSVLGNPFYMKDESKRNEVCDKYSIYFYNKIKNNDEAFINELHRLLNIYKKYGKLNLFCWCYPKRCHAEVIKNYIEKEIKNESVRM
jgi:hypothetical protein